jgi:hypothetical protein
MRKCLHLFLIVCVGAFVSVSAYAQVPTHIEFNFSGTGNMMVSPVVYSGSIDSGEPLLVGGTWDLTINDSSWPSDTDKLVRWNYIDANYFSPNYDPLLTQWLGIFDTASTGSNLMWNADATAGGLHGTAVLQITIIDWDFDEVIDADERAFGVFSGTLVVVKDGSGIWAGYCGLGSFSGSSSNADPANWADDAVEGYTILDVEDCSVPTDNVTWGQVKQLYDSE